MTPVRYLIADDSYLQREGLRLMLASQPGLELAGLATNGREAVDLALDLDVDVAVLDIVMPEQSGIEAALEIKRRMRKIGIVVLSKYDDEQYILELLQHGSDGYAYLLWETVADVRELVHAMQEVARGGTVLDPRMVNILMAKRTARTSTINELTPREREVLELVASGLSNNAIGEQLHIGGSAVEKHIRSMFLKLGLDPDDSRYHRRVLAVLEYFHLAGQMPSERGG